MCGCLRQGAPSRGGRHRSAGGADTDARGAYSLWRPSVSVYGGNWPECWAGAVTCRSGFDPGDGGQADALSRHGLRHPSSPQRLPAEHATPQPPQFAVVSSGASQPFAELPSQSPKPATHDAIPQTPPVQEGAAFGGLHNVPQLPQLSRSVAKSVQTDGWFPPKQQLVSPVEQTASLWLAMWDGTAELPTVMTCAADGSSGGKWHNLTLTWGWGLCRCACSAS